MKKSVDSAPRPANLKATTILDIDDHRVQRIAENLAHQGLSVCIRLQKAHILLISLLRPVYSVDEWQPTSKTLHKKRGSCSQRMACLEAVARSMKSARHLCERKFLVSEISTNASFYSE